MDREELRRVAATIVTAQGSRESDALHRDGKFDESDAIIKRWKAELRSRAPEAKKREIDDAIAHAMRPHRK